MSIASNIRALSGAVASAGRSCMNGMQYMGSVIASASRSCVNGIQYVGGVIGRGVSTAKNWLAALFNNTVQYTNERFSLGYHHSARYTMPFSNPNPQSTGNFITAIIFSPVYLIGIIAGGLIVPLFHHSIRSARENFNITYNILYYDQDQSKPTRPLLIGMGYGIPGMLLGLVFGTIFVTLPHAGWRTGLETLNNIRDAFDLGTQVANLDNKKLDFNYKKRTKTQLFFGIIPFGIALVPITFLGSTIGNTLWRMLVEGWGAFCWTIKKSVNLALFDRADLQVDIKPRSVSRYQTLLGILGYTIGGTIGTVVASFITSFRMLYQSGINIVNAFKHAWNLPVGKFTSLHLMARNINLNLRTYQYKDILGIPGLILTPISAAIGFTIAGGIRVIIETAFNAFNTMKFIIDDIALRGVANYNPKSNYIKNREVHEHILGIAGYPLGLIATPIATVIGIGRYIRTNIDSGKRFYNTITHKLLSINGPHPNIKTIHNDSRPILVKIISFPGILLGILAGGTVRVGNESVNNFNHSRKSWYKLVTLTSNKNQIATEYQAYQQLVATDKTRTNTDRALGGLGYLAAGILAGPVIIGIGAARLALTNADSFKRSFAKKVNARPEFQNKQIPETEDQRIDLFKQAGRPGEKFGSIAAELRIISVASVAYIEYLAKRSVQVALHENPRQTEVKINFDINDYSKYYGLPGIITGAIIGGISFIAVGGARVIYNTGETIYHVTLDMVKYVREDDSVNEKDFAIYYKIKKLLRKEDDSELDITQHGPIAEEQAQNIKTRQDKRLKTPFMMGVLGLPIGGVIGSVAALTVGVFRICKESAISAFNQTLIYTSYAIPEKFSLTANISPQNSRNFNLGFPLGQTLAIPFGITGFLVAGSIRFVVDTFIGIAVTTSQVANLPPVDGYFAPLQDNRRGVDEVLGIPGDLIGIFLGAAAYILHNITHVVINSFATMVVDIADIISWSIGSLNKDKYKRILGLRQSYEEANLQQPDERSNLKKHGYGLIGHIIGGSIGVTIGSIVILVRVAVFNIFKSIPYSFTKTANIAKQNKFNTAQYEHDNTNNKVQISSNDRNDITIPKKILNTLKYIVGTPGLALGSLAGFTFVVIPINIKNFAVNNWKSYIYLSKSLLNVGLNYPYFKETVGFDTRQDRSKAAGFIGYTIATLTTGIVPLARGLLYATFGATGVILSPIVSIVKIGLIGLKPRFKGTTSENPQEQKIRNLYSSSLKYTGEFKEGITNVKDKQTGGKGPEDFFRKALTFNIDADAEKVLGAELKKVRNPNFDLDKAIDDIKETRRGLFFFTQQAREDNDRESDQEVDTLRQEAEEYIYRDSETINIPRKRERSFAELFLFTGNERPSSTETASSRAAIGVTN